MSIVSAGTNEAAIGESVTWTQPSRTVEFPGALKPVRVVELPEVSTVLGPAHEVVAAVVIGANIIKSTKAPASPLRLYDMYARNIVDIMNELVGKRQYSEKWINCSEFMEPLGRIELPTFPLPMGCYTPKPQWRNRYE
tara:strand:- start:2851 stop:3264 length:414 start_codon:yes stop_codon:yes gene_type:complete